MITPIVVIPQNSGPKTAEHHFEMQTPLGRVAQISITTPVGVSSQEVLTDLRKGTLDQAVIRVNSPESPGGLAVLSIFAWLGFLAFGITLLVLLDLSGLLPVSLVQRPSSSWYWPEVLPYVGGTFFWTGMLRLWILGLPLVPLITYLFARKAR